MRYFTFQRIITFLFGVLALFICYFTVQSDNPVIRYGLTTFIFLYGVYVIIASVIPDKKATQKISDNVLGELFYRIVFEIPFRVIINLFTH
ncbi:MAG: hypothetical protein KC427_01810 [Sulfurovum sp.]|uniref:hypothetical protein n=1 Tax=Sulfurovum sp. TaxID=1969726 RepID=UPI002867FFB1|nr:hypothetical protein [Sulfurovum sp.]MCO4844737.1 hypothetical protein [Sulfurovum sp.]